MLPPEFHFLRPAWLLLVPVALLLVFWALRAGLDRRRWEQVCDPELLPHVLIDQAPVRRRRWPLGIAALVSLLALVALAGPTWERLPQPVFRSQSALVIALDLSGSMEAQDLTPSRLRRTRFILRDILAAREDGQTGLVVFAADAFVVSPLTDDTATIQAQLSALEPAIMPVQGSRPERGIARAVTLLDQAGVGRGEILLMTDGATEPAAAVAAAGAATAAGHRVSVLAVGTADGAPIPRAEGGFLTDADGGIVLPRVDSPTLRRIAVAGNGAFARLGVGPIDLATLSARWQRAGGGGEETGLVTDSWLDRGPWLAAFAVPFVLIAFRRGVLILAALALLPLSPQAQAEGWDDLWSRPDQRAAAALDAGDPATAQTLFEDPRWKATAAYRAGDYDAALGSLDGLDDPESLYNRGNALARAGQLGEAIASYEQALARDPAHEDARYNRDLLQALSSQQQGSGQGNGESDDENRQEQQDEQGGRQEEGDQGSEASREGQDDTQEQSGNDGSPQAGQDGAAQATQGGPDEMSAAEQAALDELAAGQSSAQERSAQERSDQERSDQETPAQQMPVEPEEGEPSPDAGADTAATASRSEPPDESEQATEQWLRRIPDDPGGLLRRKFYYQYRERGQADDAPGGEQPW